MLEPGQQPLERGVVGELQVVDHERGEAQSLPMADRLADRLAQAQRLELAGGLGSEFRQQARELADDPRLRHRAESFDQTAQQARQQAVGQARVAGVRAVDVSLAVRSGEIGCEAALADARFAQQQHRLAALPGVFENPPFTLAPDQPRRAQRGHRRGCGHRGRQRVAAFDQRGQFAGFSAGARAEFTRQCLAAALECRQCRGPVAAPVVQAHHAPMRVLGGRCFRSQAFGERQGFGDAPFGFELRRMLGESLAAPALPALTRLADPLGQFAAVFVVQRAEQRRGIRAERGLRGFEIVLNVAREGQHRLRQHDLVPGALL